MCAGILGAVMLLAVLVQFKLEMNSRIKGGEKQDDHLGINMGGIIRMQFTIWYWLSLLSFIAGAFLNYLRDKTALKEAMDSAVDFEFQKK